MRPAVLVNGSYCSLADGPSSLPDNAECITTGNTCMCASSLWAAGIHVPCHHVLGRTVQSNWLSCRLISTQPLATHSLHECLSRPVHTCIALRMAQAVCTAQQKRKLPRMHVETAACLSWHDQTSTTHTMHREAYLPNHMHDASGADSEVIIVHSVARDDAQIVGVALPRRMHRVEVEHLDIGRVPVRRIVLDHIEAADQLVRVVSL